MKTLPGILMSPSAHFQAREETAAKDGIRYARLMATDGMEQEYCELPDAINFINAECNLHSLAIQKKDFQYIAQRERFRTQQIMDAQKINEQLGLLLRQALNSTIPQIGFCFQERVKDFLSALTEICNREFNGCATLAGVGKVTVQDLSTLEALSEVDAEHVDNAYYLGGVQGEVVHVNDTLQLPMHSVTAQDPAFEKLIRACRVCLSGNLQNTQDPVFSFALTLSEEARIQDFPTALVKSARNTQKIDSALDEINNNEIIYTQELKIHGLEATTKFLEAYEEQRLTMEISRSITLQMLSDLRRLTERTV